MRRAREMVTEVLSVRSVPVRINAVSSELAAADLEAIAGLAADVRIPQGAVRQTCNGSATGHRTHR